MKVKLLVLTAILCLAGCGSMSGWTINRCAEICGCGKIYKMNKTPLGYVYCFCSDGKRTLMQPEQYVEE